jgi:hypothetical protein
MIDGEGNAVNTPIGGRQRQLIVYAAVGAALGGLFALLALLPLLTPAGTTRDLHPLWILGVAFTAGAGLGVWALHLWMMTPAQRWVVLRRVAAGAGFGAVLGLAQLGAAAGFAASGKDPGSFNAVVTLALVLVAFGAVWGALSGEGRAAADAEEAGSAAEAQHSNRAAEVKKFGLRGFARRAAFRLREARQKPDDARGLDEFGP